IVGHKSAALITPTEFVREDFAKFARVNLSKITVTHEAADKIKDAAEPVEELVNKQYIMYVGRSLPHKNLQRLVDAMEILQQQFPGLRLVFVGKKDRAYRQLRRYALVKGVRRVLFTGFVSEGQLRWLYE